MHQAPEIKEINKTILRDPPLDPRDWLVMFFDRPQPETMGMEWFLTPLYRTGEKLMLERNILRDVAQPVTKKLPTYQAEELTQGGQEAQIVLSEQIYNLRITRSGKLILTK